MKSIYNFIKFLYRIAFSLYGFGYHSLRYLLLSGISLNHYNNLIRKYDAIRVAHSLEKSMSMPNRKSNSGFKDAFKLFEILKKVDQKKINNLEYSSIDCLKKFINFKENKKNPKFIVIKNFLNNFDFLNKKNISGIEVKNLKFFKRGKLRNLEHFFLTRYSVRDFANSKISSKIIDKAIKFANKTPSVCNRQSSYVYFSNNKKIISKVLKYQSGNRGFGHRIFNLAIITTNLKSFLTAKEFYQQWIDGGMFSMSLIYSLHAMGIATCPLNWSQDPITDRKLRKIININENDTIIMLLAIGNYKSNTVICKSNRDLSENKWTKIKIK